MIWFSCARNWSVSSERKTEWAQAKRPMRFEGKRLDRPGRRQVLPGSQKVREIDIPENDMGR